MYLYLYLCPYLYQLVPYLIYRFLIYLPIYRMQEPPQQGIIHSFIHSLPPSLPPSRLPTWYICLYPYPCVCASVCLSVYLSVYLRVSVRVSVRVHVHTYSTHKRYISKIHIKDTCTRVSWGMWLFLILKIYLPIRSTQKTTRQTSVHPPCLSQLHSVNFYVQAKANFPFQIGALKRQCA